MPEAWTSRRVVVTGGTGFLGSHLVRRLLREGAEVHVVSRSITPKRSGRAAGVPVWHPLDLTEKAEPARVLALIRPDVVFHLAAYGTSPAQSDAELMARVNTCGTLYLLEACRRAGRPLVIHASSCSERALADLSDYSDQRTLYAATKLAATGICQAYDREGIVPCVIARLFTVYGPGEPSHRLIPTVARALLRGETPHVSAGDQRRDFIYVDDVIEGLLHLACAPSAPGQLIEIGTGKGISVHDVVETLVRLSGYDIPPEYGTVPKRWDDVAMLQADPESAARIAGWRATTSLEEGLRKAWTWHKRQVAEKESSVSLAH